MGFLASRNVLPKYGFPVDLVPLDLGLSGDADAARIELSRDLRLAVSDYAPGAEIVAAKGLWRSIGLASRAGRGWPTRRWATCADCGAFRHTVGEELGACRVCGGTNSAPGRAGSFVMPVFGFVGERGASGVGDSRPVRMALVESYFGEYQAGDNSDLRPIDVTSGAVMCRFSRQGRIAVVNRGPAGRGFRVCETCGYAAPAPAAGDAAGRARKHKNPRRPGRECQGRLTFRHLGHEFLTDVVEIRFNDPRMANDHVGRSVLYAVLAGIPSLDIRREEMDGTLYKYDAGRGPAVVLFDTVPGGAGHAQRVGQNLPEVLAAGRKVAEHCECGEESSCYACLRTYSNQIWHEQLVRRLAADVLGSC